MKASPYQIIPYSEAYNADALFLERGIVQGGKIRLEIVKEHFLDRAKVFEKYYAGLAITPKRQIVGSAVAAETWLSVNGTTHRAGVAFDTKVHPEWRNKKIGTRLSADFYENFFFPQHLDKTFLVARLNNTHVMKMAMTTVKKTWPYPFVYLTIPTGTRIKNLKVQAGNKQKFQVQLQGNLQPDYFHRMVNGLGFFKTDKMYRLKIASIDPLTNVRINIMRVLQPAKYGSLPKLKEFFSYAGLFGHTVENIDSINEILSSLEAEGIQQLMVCCQQDDQIFELLKSSAINRYDYVLLTDFATNADDEISMDIRCL